MHTSLGSCLKLQPSSLGHKAQLYVHGHETTGLHLHSRVLGAIATYICNRPPEIALEEQ